MRQLPIIEDTRQQVLADTETDHKPSFIVEFMYRYAPSYLLLNKGATARDHLSLERTFLAYLRSALSCLSVGIAIPQITRLPSSTPTSPVAKTGGLVLGSLFIVLGLMFVCVGCLRYFYGQALMVRGLFPASRGMVVVASVFLVGITIAVFIMTLVLA